MLPHHPRKHQPSPCSPKFTLWRARGRQSPDAGQTRDGGCCSQVRYSGGRGLADTRHTAKPPANMSPVRQVPCGAHLTRERTEARADPAGDEHRELRRGAAAQATRAVKGQGRGWGRWNSGTPPAPDQATPPWPGVGALLGTSLALPHPPLGKDAIRWMCDRVGRNKYSSTKLGDGLMSVHCTVICAF